MLNASPEFWALAGAPVARGDDSGRKWLAGERNTGDASDVGVLFLAGVAGTGEVSVSRALEGKVLAGQVVAAGGWRGCTLSMWACVGTGRSAVVWMATDVDVGTGIPVTVLGDEEWAAQRRAAGMLSSDLTPFC